MANQWVRLWIDMPNDPKWRTISRLSKQPISLVISLFVHLMCDAANADERGVTRCDAEDLASALDVEKEQIEAVLSAMDGRVLDGYKLIGWDKRQPLREDNSAERTRAWRDRKKDVTQCDADVTQCDAPDTDTDTEKNIKKTLPIGSAKEKRNAIPQKRATQIPDDYELTDAMRQFYTERLPRGDIEATWQHFTDHHRAKGSVMKDWAAAWRTWVGNELKFTQQGSRNVTPIRNGRSGFVHHTAAVAERAFAGCDVPEF
jgi:hypothetical protein